MLTSWHATLSTTPTQKNDPLSLADASSGLKANNSNDSEKNKTEFRLHIYPKFPPGFDSSLPLPLSTLPTSSTNLPLLTLSYPNPSLLTLTFPSHSLCTLPTPHPPYPHPIPTPFPLITYHPTLPTLPSPPNTIRG